MTGGRHVHELIDAVRGGPNWKHAAISPFSRRGAVDHTVYETTSILALIEHRWGLTPLSARDASAGDLHTAFDFSQTP